jgi:hypothetical protein
MSRRVGLVLAGLLAGPVFAADFEGVLELNTSQVSNAGVETGTGNAKISISKAGLRHEIYVHTLVGPIRLVTLSKTETPDLLYKINDQAKTYSELGTSTGPKPPEKSDAEPYQVKRLGEEKLLGYNTLHLLVTYKNTSNELWATRDLLDAATFNKVLSRAGRTGGEERMANALKDAGVDGMPLKSILTSADGSKTTMEVVKIEKKTLPGYTFEIPDGYEKVSPLADAADARAQMEQQNLEAVLKKLPADKRAMIESALKQRQPPPQPKQ